MRVWTCQVIGQAFFFLMSFLVAKMTPKTPKFQKNKKKNRNFFCRKNFRKTFGLSFKNIQLKYLDFGQKTADFTRFWKNFFLKICQNGKFGLVAPVKIFFFPIGLIWQGRGWYQNELFTEMLFSTHFIVPCHKYQNQHLSSVNYHKCINTKTYHTLFWLTVPNNTTDPSTQSKCQKWTTEWRTTW